MIALLDCKKTNIVCPEMEVGHLEAEDCLVVDLFLWEFGFNPIQKLGRLDYTV